jgi:hypothetical protein
MRRMTNVAIGLTNAQRRALSEMGVDVWVRRAAHGAETMQQVTKTVAVPTASEIGSVPAASSLAPSPDSTAAAEYRAELDCLATTGVVIVGRWHNPLDKRLANDVALAVATAHDPAMMQSKAKVRQTAFKWPATQTGDRSIAAARNAFKAFLRGQAERAHAWCVVLFGDAASALADDPDSAVPRVVRQPAIGALRADPNAKKALWLNVSKNVPD